MIMISGETGALPFLPHRICVWLHCVGFMTSVTGGFQPALRRKEIEAREQASEASADLSIFSWRCPLSELALPLQRGTSTSSSVSFQTAKRKTHRFSRWISQYSIVIQHVSASALTCKNITTKKLWMSRDMSIQLCDNWHEINPACL